MASQVINQSNIRQKNKPLLPIIPLLIEDEEEFQPKNNSKFSNQNLKSQNSEKQDTKLQNSSKASSDFPSPKKFKFNSSSSQGLTKSKNQEQNSNEKNSKISNKLASKSFANLHDVNNSEQKEPNKKLDKPETKDEKIKKYNSDFTISKKRKLEDTEKNAKNQEEPSPNEKNKISSTKILPKIVFPAKSSPNLPNQNSSNNTENKPKSRSIDHKNTDEPNTNTNAQLNEKGNPKLTKKISISSLLPSMPQKQSQADKDKIKKSNSDFPSNKKQKEAKNEDENVEVPKSKSYTKLKEEEKVKTASQPRKIAFAVQSAKALPAKTEEEIKEADKIKRSNSDFPTKAKIKVSENKEAKPKEKEKEQKITRKSIGSAKSSNNLQKPNLLDDENEKSKQEKLKQEKSKSKQNIEKIKHAKSDFPAAKAEEIEEMNKPLKKASTKQNENNQAEPEKEGNAKLTKRVSISSMLIAKSKQILAAKENQERPKSQTAEKIKKSNSDFQASKKQKEESNKSPAQNEEQNAEVPKSKSYTKLKDDEEKTKASFQPRKIAFAVQSEKALPVKTEEEVKEADKIKRSNSDFPTKTKIKVSENKEAKPKTSDQDKLKANEKESTAKVSRKPISSAKSSTSLQRHNLLDEEKELAKSDKPKEEAKSNKIKKSKSDFQSAPSTKAEDAKKPVEKEVKNPAPAIKASQIVSKEIEKKEETPKQQAATNANAKEIEKPEEASKQQATTNVNSKEINIEIDIDKEKIEIETQIINKSPGQQQQQQQQKQANNSKPKEIQNETKHKQRKNSHNNQFVYSPMSKDQSNEKNKSSTSNQINNNNNSNNNKHKNARNNKQNEIHKHNESPNNKSNTSHQQTNPQQQQQHNDKNKQEQHANKVPAKNTNTVTIQQRSTQKPKLNIVLKTKEVLVPKETTKTSEIEKTEENAIQSKEAALSPPDTETLVSKEEPIEKDVINDEIKKQQTYEKEKEEAQHTIDQINESMSKQKNLYTIKMCIESQPVCIAVGDIEGDCEKLYQICLLIKSNPTLHFVFIGDIIDDLSDACSSSSKSWECLSLLSDFFINNMNFTLDTSNKESEKSDNTNNVCLPSAFCDISFGQVKYGNIRNRVKFLAGNAECDNLLDFQKPCEKVIESADNKETLYVFGQGQWKKTVTYSQMCLLYRYLKSCYGIIKMKKTSQEAKKNNSLDFTDTVYFRHSPSTFKANRFPKNMYFPNPDLKKSEVEKGNFFFVTGHARIFATISSDKHNDKELVYVVDTTVLDAQNQYLKDVGGFGTNDRRLAVISFDNYTGFSVKAISLPCQFPKSTLKCKISDKYVQIKGI